MNKYPPKTSLNSSTQQYGSIGYQAQTSLQINPKRFQQEATEFF